MFKNITKHTIGLIHNLETGISADLPHKHLTQMTCYTELLTVGVLGCQVGLCVGENGCWDLDIYTALNEPVTTLQKLCSPLLVRRTGTVC